MGESVGLGALKRRVGLEFGGGGAECAANNTSAAPRGMLTNEEGRHSEEAGTAIL